MRFSAIPLLNHHIRAGAVVLQKENGNGAEVDEFLPRDRPQGGLVWKVGMAEGLRFDRP